MSLRTVRCMPLTHRSVFFTTCFSKRAFFLLAQRGCVGQRPCHRSPGHAACCSTCKCSCGMRKNGKAIPHPGRRQPSLVCVTFASSTVNLPYMSSHAIATGCGSCPWRKWSARSICWTCRPINPGESFCRKRWTCQWSETGLWKGVPATTTAALLTS